jgi:voltage-gated potassium channel
MIRPTVVDFLDSMLRTQKGPMRINQFTIAENSFFNDITIRDSGIKNKFNLLILGAKIGENEIEFNPPSHFVLKSNMTLIVMGAINDIERAKETFSMYRY